MSSCDRRTSGAGKSTFLATVVMVLMLSIPTRSNAATLDDVRAASAAFTDPDDPGLVILARAFGKSILDLSDPGAASTAASLLRNVQYNWLAGSTLPNQDMVAGAAVVHAIDSALLSLSPSSRERLHLLSELWAQQLGQAYREMLLQTFQLLRREVIGGQSLYPVLVALVDVVEARGSWDGLQPLFLYVLDDLAVWDMTASRMPAVDGQLGRLRIALGVTGAGFVASARSGRTVLASFPYAVPIGRSITNVVVELRPDLVDRLVARALDFLQSGFPTIPGWLNPGQGLEDFVRGLTRQDCLDLPSFSGLTGQGASDGTSLLSSQEGIFGDVCGGGGSLGGGSGGGGGGSSLGLGLGAGLANTCVNIYGLTDSYPEMTMADSEIRASMLLGMNCLSQRGNYGSRDCRTCGLTSGSDDDGSEPPPPPPPSPTDPVPERPDEIPEDTWATLSPEEKKALVAMLNDQESRSDALNMIKALNEAAKIDDRDKRAELIRDVFWFSATTGGGYLLGAAEGSVGGPAGAIIGGVLWILIDQVAEPPEPSAMDNAREDLQYRYFKHLQRERELPEPDGDGMLDCGEYADFMRQRLLRFDRTQFSSYPPPVDPVGQMGEVDGCDQSGVTALTAACQLTSASHCVDPSRCCASPDAMAQAAAQRGRQGLCERTYCPPNKTPVSGGTQCHCVEIGSEDEPSYEHPPGHVNPTRPGVGFHRTSTPHPFVVDGLLGWGGAMSSALSWCTTDECVDRAAFLRQSY